MKLSKLLEVLTIVALLVVEASCSAPRTMSPEAKFNQAVELATNGKFQKSVDTCLAVSARLPETERPRVDKLLGYAYKGLGMLPEAWHFLTRYLQSDGSNDPTATGWLREVEEGLAENHVRVVFTGHPEGITLRIMPSHLGIASQVRVPQSGLPWWFEPGKHTVRAEKYGWEAKDVALDIAAAGIGTATKEIRLSQQTTTVTSATTPDSPEGLFPGAKVETSAGTFRYIPSGCFEMGSPDTERGRVRSEGPVHEVCITRPFILKETEVSRSEWQWTNRDNRFDSKYRPCDDCPARSLNWFEAVAFCNALSSTEDLDECYVLEDCNGPVGEDLECGNVVFKGLDCNGYRLPTEAEWEYAARAGTKTLFAFGEHLSSDDENYKGTRPMPGGPQGEYREQPIAVGSLRPNAWGLYDVHGNATEWVWDWKGDYASDRQIDPLGPDVGEFKVHRGGSWASKAKDCRLARRKGFRPRSGLGIGFRPARTVTWRAPWGGLHEPWRKR